MIWRLPGRPWFTPHRFGFGASPTTWEGWVFTGLYVVGALVIAQAAGLGSGPFHMASLIAFFAGVALLSAVFVLFALLKSDAPWRWRWDRNAAPEEPTLKALPEFEKKRDRR